MYMLAFLFTGFVSEWFKLHIVVRLLRIYRSVIKKHKFFLKTPLSLSLSLCHAPVPSSSPLPHLTLLLPQWPCMVGEQCVSGDICWAMSSWSKVSIIKSSSLNNLALPERSQWAQECMQDSIKIRRKDCTNRMHADCWQDDCWFGLLVCCPRRFTESKWFPPMRWFGLLAWSQVAPKQWLSRCSGSSPFPSKLASSSASNQMIRLKMCVRFGKQAWRDDISHQEDLWGHINFS